MLSFGGCPGRVQEGFGKLYPSKLGKLAQAVEANPNGGRFFLPLILLSLAFFLCSVLASGLRGV